MSRPTGAGKQKLILPPRLRSPYKFVPISLAPRLAHPARLNFRWLSAHDSDVEMNEHPATSPICGWFVPNKLDNRVMVYDQHVLLGSLVADDRRTPWCAAPGSDRPLLVDQIDNHVLRQTVATLITCQRNSSPAPAPTFLAHFLTAVDTVLENIDPEDFARHQATALLMGRPIALVLREGRLRAAGPTGGRSFLGGLHARPVRLGQRGEVRQAGPPHRPAAPHVATSAS